MPCNGGISDNFVHSIANENKVGSENVQNKSGTGKTGILSLLSKAREIKKNEGV